MTPSQAAESPAAGARPYGVVGLVVSLVVILLLTALLTILFAVGAYAALVAAKGADEALALVRASVEGSGDDLRLKIAMGLTAYLALSLSVLAVARFRGRRQWAALVAWRDWSIAKHWTLLAGLFVLAIVWELGASIVIEGIHPEAKDWIVAPKETPWTIAFIALAVLFGPIAEELLFRGWMYTSLKASFGLRVAVLVSSVLFALAHWESTHLYALAVFPIGLCLAAVRERTGSIAGSITFHTLYNGAASILLFLGK